MLKHIHLLSIVISVVLFIIQFVWRMRDSTNFDKKWVKVVPPLINIMLLSTGIALIVITGFIPFTANTLWMTEKLMCVIAYLAFGFIALHFSQDTVCRLFAFFGALGWVYAITNLAVTKTPQLLG
ncbi:SirB2 family protein [Candidatus Enterovibrio escicola]|uniref:SirB2 family protein n=1 Tax=Candidatus Enterovibrio escicola TaxID=1927127 RepID=UPI0021E049E7|nr:SirB2 family protein [Candidatus Enterovibrio escacola]